MSGKSELFLFDKPTPQVVIENAVFMDVNPTTSLGENAQTIDFVINGSETLYLDMNDTLLYLRINITNALGVVLPAGNAVVPVNFFMNSLFSDVTLSLNDTVIEGGNQMYAYKSTIENIFNFNRDAKDLQLEASGFNENNGTRRGWVSESKQCELMGALRLDFLNQPKYLFPGINVKISMQKHSNPRFSIVGGGGDYRINIMQAKLYVRRVDVARSVLSGHIKGLQTQNMMYPYDRSQVVTYTIANGSLSHYKDNLFSNSLLPKLVIVGLVSQAGYNGTEINSNAFNFHHFNVNSVGLYRDGQAVPYREVYEPDFANNLCTRDYMKSIVQCTQHLNSNTNNGITMELFKNGYTFFTFNLTPDFDFNQRQMPRDGNLRLELKFAVPLPAAINVVVYATFDSTLQITKDRQIIRDNAI